MVANPIPDDLRSEHLFLLVGTNPLPDWVAAKLLLRTGGRVHLFSTDGVRKHAARLKRVLEENEKMAVSTYETAAADANVIYKDVERQVAKLVRGSDTIIGLNVRRKFVLEAIARRRYVPACSFAILYAAIGDKDYAFEWLERPYQDRAFDIAYLQVDPFFDVLRPDPRFADLGQRAGL